MDIDVEYKANDPGSKHSNGVFLSYFILHSKVWTQVVLHAILLKETIWLQPMLPNANRGKIG